uniref:Uncharacterized protein n=1 Tax=Setaria viridis TaxID=4556 RepID=A0A4U6U843_SETVI|nr:hypothetical protein SEVIR_5G003200v2 [Setaria viridis]
MFETCTHTAGGMHYLCCRLAEAKQRHSKLDWTANIPLLKPCKEETPNCFHGEWYRRCIGLAAAAASCLSLQARPGPSHLAARMLCHLPDETITKVFFNYLFK